jgi:flagellar biosynthetic protein FliR
MLLAAGMDRILIGSLVRSLRTVPPGTFQLTAGAAAQTVAAASGIFLAALELAAPVLGATLIVEVAIAILSRISPQLPVMSLTVPLKTITGYVVLIGTVALWPHFIGARFSALLDLAGRVIAGRAAGAFAGGL